MNYYVTFHRVLDLIEEFQKQSPILNTFAYGNLVDFGQLHVSGGTVEYPFLFAVPQSIQYDENTTTYQMSLIFADILNYDLSNEKDCVSDMSLEAKRFLSYLKRGIHTFPDLYDNLDINFPVQAIPFFERFGDHVGGVAVDCNLIIFEDLNACDYYITPTPTAEPTSTPQPTPSMTPTPTCPQTTQYLEVQLQENTKFKLVLWNQPDFSSPATAQCDYSISGVAYGDMGTVYFGEESILQGQHQHQFDLADVLQPGEIVSAFGVISANTSGCTCPVTVVLPPNCENCDTNIQSYNICLTGGTGDFSSWNENYVLTPSYFGTCGYIFTNGTFEIQITYNGVGQLLLSVLDTGIGANYDIFITSEDCEAPQYAITPSSSTGTGTPPNLNFNCP